MKDVFVETNWVVDYCAPAHQRVPAAVELLKAANSGDIKLHLPSPCISESRSVTRLKIPTERSRFAAQVPEVGKGRWPHQR